MSVPLPVSFGGAYQYRAFAAYHSATYMPGLAVHCGKPAIVMLTCSIKRDSDNIMWFAIGY